MGLETGINVLCVSGLLFIDRTWQALVLVRTAGKLV